MAVSILSFKQTVFRYNPEKLVIHAEKMMWSEPLPDGRTWSQEIGCKPRIIEGEGVLYGDDLNEQLAALLELFAEKDSGTLVLPNLLPMPAYFSELEAEREASLPVMRYRFVFTEDTRNGSTVLSATQGVHYRVQKGDTLPLVAAKLGTTVEALCADNPQAADGMDLMEGEVLWISSASQG